MNTGLGRKLREGLDLFMLQYDTEEACAGALFAARWPNGFCCTRCGKSRAYSVSTRKLYQCASCAYQISLIAGTVFENSRTKLTKWFIALFLISCDAGISAVKLQQLIGTTYKTAWLMLTKIRYAMSRSMEASLLSGIVRVNTAIYGSRYLKSIDDRRGEHAVVIGASVEQGGEPIQIKIRHLPKQEPYEWRGRMEATKNFRARHVDPQTTEVLCVYKRFDSGRFKPLLSLVGKATGWIHKTFGGIGAKHLQAYLDEFSCRYNLNNAIPRSPDIFLSALELCSTETAMKYYEIVDPGWRRCSII